MPAGERRAAQTLIASYPLIGLKTVAEFSPAGRRVVADDPALRRPARLPELSGIPVGAAGRACRAAAVAGLAHHGRAVAPARPRPSPILEAELENIRETFRHVSDRQLSDIVDQLANRRGPTSILVGGRFTDPLARYMAAHLDLIRPDVFHLVGQESIWRDRLIDMGKRDVLLIFDIRRYQDSLVRFAEKAHQRGVQIVLFTDQWLSPIARFARHVIAGRTAVPSAWDSSASLFVVAETLIGALTRKLENESAQAHPRDRRPALSCRRHADFAQRLRRFNVRLAAR